MNENENKLESIRKNRNLPIQSGEQHLAEGRINKDLNLDSDIELQKINNLLKKKVKEKKSRDKALHDSIIHDKINSLAKNSKLSKKEKNQLLFLRKLESRLVRHEEAREGGTTRRKQKAMLNEHVAQRVSSSNASFLFKGQTYSNGSKIGFHNLIFNDLKFQTELI